MEFKSLKKPFPYFHLRNAEPKFQGSRLNGLVCRGGHRQTDRHTDIQANIGNHLKL